MKKAIIVLLFLSISCFSCTFRVHLNSKSYFDTNREYQYRALYIDTKGDTITDEKLVLKPLGRPWICQPWLQTAVRYIYFTDTSDYKNYINPDPFFYDLEQKYYAKKGKLKLWAKETTGAYYNETTLFHMHPPRTNQYDMLFHAPHPKIVLEYLTDSVTTYMDSLMNYGLARFYQEKTITPLPDTTINHTRVKAWNMFVNSVGDYKYPETRLKIYDSTLDAIFTKEYGFVKLHYTFENGIRILFDLTGVIVSEKSNN